MLSILDLGLIDTFRLLYPNANNCNTFWNNESQRNLNEGQRHDYCQISTALRNALVSMEHKTDISGSDNFPVIATFDWQQIENQAKVAQFLTIRDQSNTDITMGDFFRLATYSASNFGGTWEPLPVLKLKFKDNLEGRIPLFQLLQARQPWQLPENSEKQRFFKNFNFCLYISSHVEHVVH